MAIRSKRAEAAARRRAKEADADLGIPGYVGAEVLGQGGFGTVYRARQVSFNRSVAVKVLAAPALSEETKARFERECLAIGTLSGHPHIVTVYDSGLTSSGRAFIAMDYLKTGSIADRIRVRGPLPVAEAVDVGVKIAGAVETAHRSGVLHRDIKPENILISDYGDPKLADFGVSTVPGAYQTSTASITGSIAHAAPEVLSGQRATKVSDVYSLASTIFHMIEGRPPFARGDDELLAATIARILRDPTPELGPAVPRGVAQVIEKALSKDPADRYASAETFGSALMSAAAAAGIETSRMVLPAAAEEAPTGPHPPTPAASRTGDMTMVRVAVPGGPRLRPATPLPAKERTRRTPLVAGASAAAVLIGAAGVAALRPSDEPVSPSSPAQTIAVFPTTDLTSVTEERLLEREARERAERRRERQAEQRRKRRAEARRKRLAQERRERRAAAAAAPAEPAPAEEPAPAYSPPPPPPPTPPPPNDPPPN